MHPAYEDITSKLGEPLWWFDERVAVPRYDTFHPNMCNIYDHVVALTAIRCQNCHKKFLVSVGFDKLKEFNWTKMGNATKMLYPTEKSGGWFDSWGDPPIHGCAGDTMTSELVKINEFWMKDYDVKSPNFMEWVRYPEYEFDYSTVEEHE